MNLSRIIPLMLEEPVYLENTETPFAPWDKTSLYILRKKVFRILNYLKFFNRFFSLQLNSNNLLI